MGLGDEIMALGRLEAFYEKTGQQAAICDKSGQFREHSIWNGHPAYSKQHENRIVDAPGARPYIKRWEGNQIIFNLDYRARAGKIHFQKLNLPRLPEKFAVIAPNLKEAASPNKNWGFENFQALVDILDYPLVQPHQAGERLLEGVIPLATPSLNAVLSLIAASSLVICNEGGSHHMAASLGVPAVVIFGAFVPPQVTGYDFHKNFGVETPEGYCGKFDPCAHCKKAMEKITPDMVKMAALEILERK